MFSSPLSLRLGASNLFHPGGKGSLGTLKSEIFFKNRGVILRLEPVGEALVYHVVIRIVSSMYEQRGLKLVAS